MDGSKIHVEAFVRDLRILRLNVTFLTPLSSTYDLMVSSVIDGSNKTSHCKILNHCAVFGISPKIQSVIVPTNNEFVLEHQPCFFENDCTYKIVAKPFDSKKSSYSLIHHIKGITQP